MSASNRRAALLFLVVGLAAAAARAEPPDPVGFQLSVGPPVQLFDEERSVKGFRLSLLRGANRDVTGFDLSGVATSTRGSLRGLQIGAAHEVDGDGTGVQIAAFASYVEGRFRGVQLAGMAVRAGRGSGGQIAALGCVAAIWKGFQIGLVNRAEELEGLQIGLLNFNERGFLPVFPIFNLGR